MKEQFNGYVLNDDLSSIDFRRVTEWLSGSYWSPRITQAEVEKGARHSSLVVGAYDSEAQQVGYARVASDKTRFGYVMDVFVDEGHRRKGLAGAMIQFALAHPEHQDIYIWLLATLDAHRVYERIGFKPLDHAERWMMIRKEKTR